MIVLVGVDVALHAVGHLGGVQLQVFVSYCICKLPRTPFMLVHDLVA